MSVARWTLALLAAALLAAGCGGDDEPQAERSGATDTAGAQTEAGDPAAAAGDHGHRPVPAHRNPQSHKDTPWSYGGADGPERWASLDPDWKACAGERRQSPIDLGGARPAPPDPLELGYHSSPSTLENNGHSVEGSYHAGSHLTAHGERWELIQFHFHAPSEHAVGGREFPVELHFVHTRGDDDHLVLAAFAQAGEPNAEWDKVAAALPREEGGTARVESLNAGELLPAGAGSAERYSYVGSLTTPPCTEGVRWHVLREPIEMSPQQLLEFTAVFEGNHRPLQARAGRPVRLHRAG